MPANCPWEKTASAPCSMVSLILSCFSSFREICSGTPALLNGLEYVIVTQDCARKPIRNLFPRNGFTFPADSEKAFSPTVRTVLLWSHEDCLYSLRRGALAKGHRIWKASKSPIQVFEMRQNHHR